MHKNKNGVMYNHVSATEVEHPKRFMCRDELYRHLINEGARLGKCFDDECGGYFYPEEIEKAFELLAERDGTPVSDAEKAALVAYRNRFPAILEGGGSHKNHGKGGRHYGGGLPPLNSFIYPMIDGKCYIQSKNSKNKLTMLKQGGRYTRKTIYKLNKSKIS
jgi:hypothetical protein